ncbi:MAG: prephenate dehydrogenase/arogenate dehydrogenase family protein [Verrucomicrobiaceae bacterium]|nr:prephenate dehydrogenase/arogenate dehydrogenase family protein [Verrucomicrobiaceae bacterium]
MSFQESSIAILSPGLLGGSLILAIRKKYPLATIRVWARRAEALDEVKARVPSAICCTTIAEAVADASLAVLCMPVEHMLAAAEQIGAARVRPELIVTDVGSVKGAVVSALEPVLAQKGITFLGSHPMAGSHATGMAHARADLFQNAACLITPTERTPAEALERLKSFWSTLGCHLLIKSPTEHDRCVARVSHLPHVMAALTTLAALRADPSHVAAAAGGMRDTTRVAAGDPGLWTGILSQNRAEVLAALQDAALHLQALTQILSQHHDTELHDLLSEAKSLRDLITPHGG